MLRSLTPLVLIGLLTSCATAPPAEYVGSWKGMYVYTGNGVAIIPPEVARAARASADKFRARAAAYRYQPPGPEDDEWGVYIRQAANRFGIPERWVREVMHQESGGRLRGQDGSLITSWAGAMGLMQVMPGTYEILRRHYGLGSDPYDPQNNILAGAAYIREMYDRYGAPGFLAAYNAGPQRVDAFLTNHVPLPSETRNYIARVAPRLGEEVAIAGPFGAYATGGVSDDAAISNVRYGSASGGPDRAASSEMASTAPVYVGGYRPPLSSELTYTAPQLGGAGETDMAQLTLRPGIGASNGGASGTDAAADSRARPSTPHPVVVDAMATRRIGARFIDTDTADDDTSRSTAARSGAYTNPDIRATAYTGRPPRSVADSAGSWGLDLGMFKTEAASRETLSAAHALMDPRLADLTPVITPVQKNGDTQYRVELVGLNSDSAVATCDTMIRHGLSCYAVPPGSL